MIYAIEWNDRKRVKKKHTNTQMKSHLFFWIGGLIKQSIIQSIYNQTGRIMLPQMRTTNPSRFLHQSFFFLLFIYLEMIDQTNRNAFFYWNGICSMLFLLFVRISFCWLDQCAPFNRCILNCNDDSTVKMKPTMAFNVNVN